MLKKNTLPLGAGGHGASTTMSSWGLGPRGHGVVLPRQNAGVAAARSDCSPRPPLSITHLRALIKVLSNRHLCAGVKAKVKGK
eukprot:238845-Pyramimonas_sp.AAC.1